MARYIPNELEVWRFLPAVTNKAAPTVAQVTAGQILDGELASVGGFTFAGSTVDTPDMGSRFAKKTAGTYSADDSTMQFYKDDVPASVAETIRSLMPVDTRGFIPVSYTHLTLPTKRIV